MPKREPVGEWTDDDFTAFDGRRFQICSSKARHEDRWYSAKEYVPDGSVVHAGRTSPGENFWRNIPGDGSFSKSAQRTRVERYVRETTTNQEQPKEQ